ncbi:MAG: cadmium resistance transporter [Spirirestis rafaelensis WJT71-NPBG6]|jgi:cadmium resistance transport/sequestration family protein|nr:cadmium resistance transporter [Spirirestis rafaelensis WJT71-NPBG6]
MSELVTALFTGVTAFSATNIDDMVLLTLFFSQVNAKFRRWHIVAGQYIGFATLIILSIPGFFGGLMIPRPLIGLFGLLPILIGIKCLLNFEDTLEEDEGERPHNNSILAKLINLQVYSVAAVTVANGTDNISIYVPLFASRTWESLLVILAVFFLLVGVLCYVAYKLTHNKAIALVMTGYGNKFMPFVLIGLGAFIMVDSGTLSLLNVFNGEISPYE